MEYVLEFKHIANKDFYFGYYKLQCRYMPQKLVTDVCTL
jgi:hypothetical protein